MAGPLQSDFTFDASHIVKGLTAHVTLVGVKRANFRIRTGLALVRIGFKITGMGVVVEGIENDKKILPPD
jgi:hypothetical protein